MPDFRYAIDVDRVPSGRAAPVQIDDHWYVICNDRGTFYAGDNLCPHAGGSLGRGDVHGGCVVCPVHHWPWDLRSGLSDANMPWIRLKLYRCELRGDQAYVDVSAPLPPAD